MKILMFEVVTMLALCIGIVGPFLAVLTLSDYCSNMGTLKIPVIIGTISLLSWIILAVLIGYNFEKEVKTLTVYTIDNIDVIVYDGEIINLNHRFNRDFESGETNFEFIKEQYVYGLHHNGALVKPE